MPPSSPPRVVAVTGAAGYLGGQMVARLAAQDSVQSVVATDIRPPAGQHPKVHFLQQDITMPLEHAFQEHGVEAVVHLAFVLRQGRDHQANHRVNVEGAASVLRACEAAGVHRIVLMSSSTVYGADPRNPIALDENAPYRPPRGFHYAWDKRESEQLFEHYAVSHAEATVSILRGCVVMGPSASNFITSALFRPVLIGIRGYDPPLQFVHEEDVTELLWRFVAEAYPGVYNVAGPGTVRWSELARLADRLLLWLPPAIAYPLTQLTWWLRLQSDSPAVGLDWIRYPWVVSTERLERETGYQFQYTGEEALRSFLASRSASHVP